ncbi:SusC/RagA family TonB-linked outer membrane protein [Paraflavisolibacter sp. H34]|uniref:SusC/RagA family TonB-linked outer membrane protein n=1 Tax=Huijunlia imazamoxiresistens TaxID=3127457 RepID=UPI003018EEEB
MKKLYRAPAALNHLFLLCSLLLFSAAAFSQTISGTVTDGAKKPIGSVSVQVKGTSLATVTNEAGKFSIKASESDVLVFSNVGYATQEVALKGRQSVTVALVNETRNLENVVVTALGMKRESRKLAYSAETVKMNEVQQSRTTNFTSALEGKIAGLDISPPSAGAGASNKIRLRGQVAFAGANNSPLIVINGLPMDLGARGTNADGPNRDLGDNLQMINPDDIESMTVLKGATAAALYGSRAANGAIIITTKNGSKNSGLGIDFTSSYASDEVLDLTDFQYEYGQGVNGVRPANQGAAVNSGQFGWGERYDGKPTVQFDGESRPYEPHRNRLKQFFRTGSSFTNTIALSSGNAKGSFRASYTNQDVKGITPNNDYHKKIFNLGVNQNIGEKLTAQVNINYANEKNVNPPQVGVQGIGAMNFIIRTSPTVPLNVFEQKAVNAAGIETQTTGFAQTLINPYWVMPRQFFTNRRDRLLGTATLRYQFFDWLYLQGRVNMDNLVDFTEQNSPTGTGSPANGAYYTDKKTTYNGTYTVSEGNQRQMNYDFLLGGNHKVGDFSVDASFGGNVFTEHGRTFSQDATAFVVRDLYTIENGTVRNQSYGIGRRQINSLYGVAELGYKNLAFINLSGRNDWFSVLNPKSNSYFYPSVGGSFVFTELLKDRSWLNFGKLRFSYADVGSENGIGIFSGMLTYGFLQQPFNGYTLATINNTNNPNPNIRPFGVREKEVGIQLKMFNGKVNLDVAAYDKQTRDQIVTITNSIASGYNGTTINFGSLQNRGLEFLLDLTPVKTTHFSWNSAFNTAYNTTKVLALTPGTTRTTVADWSGGNEFIGSLVYEVGKPLNQISSRTYLRDDQGNILVGADGRLRATTTNVLHGSALPKYTGGWNNTFRYKTISLHVQVDYKAGGKLLSSTALNALRQGHSRASLVGRREGESGVVFPGVYQSGPEAGKPNTTAVFGQAFYADYRNLQIADPFIFKSDFIKLRNITLTHDFSNLVGTKYIKGLVLSAYCRNVLILKKHTPDIDPEAVQSSGDFRVGYEAASLPTTRTYGLNLNVKL